MEYNVLVDEVINKGINFKEISLSHNKEWGLCKGNVIAINKNLDNIQKKCVLAEELGHFYTTVGDITDLSNINNLKQEVRARRWGYKKLIPLSDLKKAYNKGLKCDYEIAEELGVTVSFLNKCIEYYKCRDIDI